VQQLRGADRLHHARAGRDRRATGGVEVALNETPLSVSEACDAILRDVTPLDTEVVPLRESLGRVLAEDIRSPLALPPWDNASMDGYAVRAADVRGAARAAPVSLRVGDTVAAGTATSRAVAEGEAIRIMTGAPVPAGADSVIRVEDTDAGTSTVRINSDRDALRNVRPRGEDLAKGDAVASSGTELHPGHIGLLSSVGRAEVRVHRRPRVAVLASGDELVDVDRFAEVLAGERIVTSNSYSLDAAVRQTGAVAVSLGTVGDDPIAIRDRLGGCDCDLLLTTGGVSVGEFDFTRSVLAELGATQRFWRVRIRPGAPVGFGLLRGTPWLGLPGNPVSTLVTFELFARPAIRKLMGHAQLFRRPTRVRLAEAVTITAPLTHFLRAVVTAAQNGYVARLTGPQGSGLLSSMARANALLIVPAESARLEAGSEVDAILLRDDVSHDTHVPVR
jgi:molybdopterin molybdotransferase